MSVRIHRRPTSGGGFAQIPNEALRDQRLSYRARGMLAEILSRPDDWSTSAAAIAAQARQMRGAGGEGLWSVLAAFAELEASGYLQRPRLRGPRGQWRRELHWYDSVSAGRADDSSTGGRFAEVSVADASAAETSASARSSRRPRTKTDTNTGNEHRRLSLGSALQLPPGLQLADDERDGLASWIIARYGTDLRKPPRAYLRGIPASHVPELLEEFRGSSIGHAVSRRPAWCGNCHEATRMREDDVDRRPYRCPECHPAAAGQS